MEYALTPDKELQNLCNPQYINQDPSPPKLKAMIELREHK